MTFEGVTIAKDRAYATLHNQALSVVPSQFPYGLLPTDTDVDGDVLSIVAVDDEEETPLDDGLTVAANEGLRTRLGLGLGGNHGSVRANPRPFARLMAVESLAL